MSESKKIRCVIVDDEQPARMLLRSYLSNEPDMEVIGEAENGETALRLTRHKRADVMFLDINMPGMTGMELAAHLTSETAPYIVFVTAYDEFAVKAFEYHALDYLLKPFTKARFRETLEHIRRIMSREIGHPPKAALKKALETLQYSTKLTENPVSGFLSQIIITTLQPYKAVEVTDIEWIEAADHYVFLHLKGKKYLHNLSIKKLETLLNPKDFCRIHRKYLINLNAVESVNNSEFGTLSVTLKGKTRLKVSRGKRDYLRLLLLK